jgi:hypothetical protein
MNDKIPGSCWDNPIWYKNYRIYLNDYSGPGDHLVQFAYSHDDYDGAPDGNDNRFGYAATVEACKSEIDNSEEA